MCRVLGRLTFKHPVISWSIPRMFSGLDQYTYFWKPQRDKQNDETPADESGCYRCGDVKDEHYGPEPRNGQ